MKKLAKLLSVAFALSLMTAGAADAAPRKSRQAQKQTVNKRANKAKQRSQQRSQRSRVTQSRVQQRAIAKKISSQKAAALIKQKLGANAKQVISRTTQVHPKMTEHVAMVVAKNGQKSFVKVQVRNDGTMIRQAGGKVTPAEAQQIAHLLSRRERGPNKGTFSGVRAKNVTSKSYIFSNKTDANERIEVAVNMNKDGSVRARKVETKPAASSQSASAYQSGSR